ncbi:MAG: 5-methylcytosine-specific restriction enzyme subunit McrC [Bacteroidetes bacterium HLUCCA01]|nr:MAG: 5-methylcytosine-specific restriction enzyme subunit McrC [Bacteroidetes bacterium HLUCCA01]
MSSAIPIENLCYMLSYAWDIPITSKHKESGIDDFESPIEWFSRLLLVECSYIFRKGLQVDYKPEFDVLKKVRGRINVRETARLMYLKHTSVSCNFDELSTHTTLNIILKSTLTYLLRSYDITASTRKQLRGFFIKLGDVPILDPSGIVSINIGYTRSNRYYQLAIHICKLIASQISVHQVGNATLFIDYERDHAALARLFESFVRNYYTRHLTDAKVGATNIHWNFNPTDAASRDILPIMRTDIVIEKSDQIVIADTKFYGRATGFREYESGNRESLHSGHLYQLTSYMTHFANGHNKALKGLLLYAARNNDFSYAYRWGKHDVAIRTINLDKPWREIDAALNAIIES